MLETTPRVLLACLVSVGLCSPSTALAQPAVDDPRAPPPPQAVPAPQDATSPLPDPEPEPGPSGAERTAGDDVPADDQAARQTPTDAPTGVRMTRAGIAFTSLGVAALGASLAMAVLGSQTNDALRAEDADGIDPDGGFSAEEAQRRADLLELGPKLDRAAYSLLIAGGIVTLTGAFMIAAGQPWKRKGQRKLRLSASPTRGGGAFSLGGSF